MDDYSQKLELLEEISLDNNKYIEDDALGKKFKFITFHYSIRSLVARLTKNFFCFLF